MFKFIDELPNPSNGKSLKSLKTKYTIDFLEKNKEIVEIHFETNFIRKDQIQLEAQIRIGLSKSKFPHKVKVFFTNLSKERSNPNDFQAPTNNSANNSANNSFKNPHPIEAKPTPNIKKIIAVASGKGGVGKSTVSVNLATSLAEAGYKVGLLDADIYGPSIGKLMGLEGKIDLEVQNNKIIPIQKYGMKVISFSFLIEEEQAVVWRGPMLGKALEQFIFDISWGELDYLIIDLPPGTGDTQLSLAQLVKLTGALIVTTPQKVATQDALRSVKMFEQLKIPVLGFIKNMSEFVCPHCQKPTHIFSDNGIHELEKKLPYPIISQIPLTVDIMQACENGKPVVLQNNTTINSSFSSIVNVIVNHA